MGASDVGSLVWWCEGLVRPWRTERVDGQAGVQAADPRLRCFGELRAWLDAHEQLLAGRRVLMYCTGGVRCERASAYLRSKGPAFQDVFQLQGALSAPLHLPWTPLHSTNPWPPDVRRARCMPWRRSCQSLSISTLTALTGHQFLGHRGTKSLVQEDCCIVVELTLCLRGSWHDLAVSITLAGFARRRHPALHGGVPCRRLLRRQEFRV